MGFPELGRLVLQRNIIFDIKDMRESQICDPEGYLSSLITCVVSDYQNGDIVRLGVDSYAEKAVQAMKTHDPKHKQLLLELAVYVGGSVASKTDDFIDGEVEKQIRKAIKNDREYRSFGKRYVS